MNPGAPLTVPSELLHELAKNLLHRAKLLEQAELSADPGCDCTCCKTGGPSHAFRESARDLIALAKGENWRDRPPLPGPLSRN